MDETKRFDPEQAEALFREVGMIPVQKRWFDKGTPPCGCLTVACAIKADPSGLAPIIGLKEDLDEPLFAQVGRLAGFSVAYSRGLLLGWDGFPEEVAKQWESPRWAQYGGPEVMDGYADGLRAWENTARLRLEYRQGPFDPKGKQ